jgi:hypothetical protein
VIVTPFAQILASLRNVRNNYMRLTNLSGLKGKEHRRSSTTYSPVAQIVAHQTHPLSQPHRTSTTSINPTILTTTSISTGQAQQQQTTPTTLISANQISNISTSSSSIKEQPMMSNQQLSQQTPILTNQASTSSQQSNDQNINWNLISLQSNNPAMVEKMAFETLEELGACSIYLV